MQASQSTLNLAAMSPYSCSLPSVYSVSCKSTIRKAPRLTYSTMQLKIQLSMPRWQFFARIGLAAEVIEKLDGRADFYRGHFGVGHTQ